MAATRINEDNQGGAYRSILYLNPDFLGQQKSARRRRLASSYLVLLNGPSGFMSRKINHSKGTAGSAWALILSENP